MMGIHFAFSHMTVSFSQDLISIDKKLKDERPPSPSIVDPPSSPLLLHRTSIKSSYMNYCQATKAAALVGCFFT